MRGYLDNNNTGWSISATQNNTWDLELFEDQASRNIQVNVVCIPLPDSATLDGEYGPGTGFAVAPGTQWDMFNAHSVCLLGGESGNMSNPELSGGAGTLAPGTDWGQTYWLSWNGPGNGWAFFQCLTFANLPDLSQVDSSRARRAGVIVGKDTSEWLTTTCCVMRPRQTA